MSFSLDHGPARRFARPIPLGDGLRPAAQACLIGAAILGVFLFTVLFSPKLVGAALIGGLVAVLLWQRPMWGVAALVLLGPAHQFLMLLIFRAAGATFVLKAAQLWKEMVVLVLLLKVVDVAFRRRAAPRLYLVDLLLLLFIGYATVYLAYPNQIDNSNAFVTAAFGLRADTFFLFAYFVGRGLPITPRQTRGVLICFLIITVIVAIIAAVQVALPGLTNAFFANLGLNDFLATQGADASDVLAVRENDIAGVLLPRASSLLLSDLALAFYSLLAAPMAAAFLITVRRQRWFVVANALVLWSFAMTVLTVTRSAMFAVPVALGALAARTGRVLTAVLVVVELGLLTLPIAAHYHVTSSVLSAMFSLKEGSAQGHLRAFQESITVISGNPLGLGLGTAGLIGQRFDPGSSITNESWYLQLATEMGVPAAILFALVLAALAVLAFQRWRQVRDPAVRILCLGMAGATIGFAMVGFTLHVWSSLTTSIEFWLLAGLAVQAREIDARAAEDGTPPGP